MMITHYGEVISHDKTGNLVAMNAATGKELWWKTMGSDNHTDTIPLTKGSGPVWTYGIDAYQAVGNHTFNTIYP